MNWTSGKKIVGAAAPPHTVSEFFSLIISLSFWIIVFYLALGIAAAFMRTAGLPDGARLENFLDSEAVAALSLTGTIDTYINAVATGELTPFWNRVLLSSITIFIIMLESLLFGAVFSSVFLTAERRISQKKMKGSGPGKNRG